MKKRLEKCKKRLEKSHEKLEDARKRREAIKKKEKITILDVIKEIPHGGFFDGLCKFKMKNAVKATLIFWVLFLGINLMDAVNTKVAMDREVYLLENPEVQVKYVEKVIEWKNETKGEINPRQSENIETRGWLGAMLYNWITTIPGFLILLFISNRYGNGNWNYILTLIIGFYLGAVMQMVLQNAQSYMLLKEALTP